MQFDFRGLTERKVRASSLRRSIGRKREYYYSLFVTVVVKILLFFSLWMLFISSIRIMRTSFKGISGAWRVALAAVVAIIACIIGLYIYMDIKEIRRYNRELKEGRATDPHP